MEQPERTRDRILRIAWDLAAERPVRELTLAQIAQAAGVSRQALYLHFSNRAGLLAAMIRHHDETTGLQAEIDDALRDEDPARGLERLVRLWAGYLPEIRPVTGDLEAAILLGDEGGDALGVRLAELRVAFRIAVGRAGNRGLLRADVDRDEAADLIWAAVHPSAWRHLVEERGWSAERFAYHAAGIARAYLAAPITTTTGSTS